MGAPFGLDSGMRVPSGLNSGTGAFSGLNSGTGARSSSVWHSRRAILSSPSAAVQGRSSSHSAFSLEAGIVAGSRTWTDVTSSSGSAAIHGSVAPCGDGSLVAPGSDSPSAVGTETQDQTGPILTV